MSTFKSSSHPDLLFKDEVYAIIGTAMEVSNHLGAGFYETVYHEALEIEFATSGIVFESQKLISIQYKGHLLAKEFVADFLCYDQIIVEIKALKSLAEPNEAQVINYLKATLFGE